MDLVIRVVPSKKYHCCACLSFPKEEKNSLIVQKSTRMISTPEIVSAGLQPVCGCEQRKSGGWEEERGKGEKEEKGRESGKKRGREGGKGS